MNPSEIKTADDLVKFATETGKRLDEVETAAESVKSIPDITAELKLVKEQLASVHTWVKNVDAKPNSDTEEGALHTLGSIANNMLKAYKAEGDERREASKAIRKMGAVPTRAVSENGKHESFEVAKGYEEKAGASTDPLSSDDSDSGNYFGSYLVPVDTVPELMRIAADNSALMGRVTSRPVRGITTYVPTTTDAMTMTKLTNQETAKTEDNITFSRATLTTESYAFWVALTEEMDEDSLILLGALIRQMGGEAWGTKFDSLCLEDTTYGSMANANINQVTMGAGSSTFSSVTPDDLNAMIAKLTTRAKRQGGEFYMSATVWDELADYKNADGDYIYRHVSEAAPLRHRGYPVTLTDGMPDLADSAAGTDFIAFGNPKYILHGDRVGFEFRIFDQTQSTMEYDEIFLRVRVRAAFTNAIPTAWVKLTTAA